jgi:Asp-tRNA(Asn)/Glu-tRNA(Gln) amidotransferase B subunit
LDYDICNYAKKKNNAFAKYIDSETVPMGDKEIKQDYRFMPEPNLPPLCLFLSWYIIILF